MSSILDDLTKQAGSMGVTDWLKTAAGAAALANSLKSPEAAQSPDYFKLAQQQADLQKQAAQEQTLANRPNQTNAAGDTSTWTQDPVTGAWTQKQQFGESNQGLFDQTQGLKSGLLGQAANQGQLSTEGMPQLGGIVMDPQGSNDAITQAWLARMNPQLEKQRNSELQRLANMGITESRSLGGNAAYENAMDRLNRNEVDATNQALIQGTNAYNQAFNNSLGADSANRSNQGQMFSQSKTIADQPYNYLQMLAGTTPSNPIFGQYTSSTGYQSPDMYGAGQDQYAAGLAQANAKNAASNNLTQGLWGLAKPTVQPGA